MLHLAHVRDLQAAEHWLARHRRRLDAGGVPLLVVGVTEAHAALRQTVARSGLRAYFLDATGAHACGDDVMAVPSDQLHAAGPFLDKASRARKRLHVLLVEDRLQPDLAWCVDHVQTFEAIA